MKKAFLLISLCLGLSACLPLPALVGTAGISAGFVAAKDTTFSESVDDIRIQSAIKRHFIAKGFRKLYTKIKVSVSNSRVLLTGKVDSDQDIINAVDIAWAQKGVKEVLNELSVSEDSSYFNTAEYTRDSWITSRVKARTISNRDIKFINYNIVTSSGIVYISGLARSQEELDKVANLAAEVKGVKKVVIHARIIENFAPKDSNEQQ